MFKKQLSWILCVALLVLSVVTAPAVSAESAPAPLVQDFENYEYAADGATKNRLAAYTLYTANGDDSQVHSGTKSLYRSATSSTYRVSVFPEADTAPLQAGNEYELRFWLKIAAAIPGTGTIQLMYSSDKNNANAQIAGSSTPNICVLKKPNETSTNVDTGKVGEWQEIVYTFTATHTGYLNLSGWGTNEYYLDDISLKKVGKSTLFFETNGGSTVEPLTQNAGTALTLPANPTKEGFVFDGWYLDAALTTPFTATTFPENDTTLYAKWKAPGAMVQDFENYEYAADGATKNRLAAYTLYTANGDDSQVHSGTKSLYRSATSSTYRVAVFPEADTAPLQAGNEYELRFWLKIAAAIPGTGTIQLMYSSDKNNANAQVSGSSLPNICVLKKPNEASTNVDAGKVGEWQEIVYTFTATHTGYLNLSGWGTNEYYLDDISLKKVGKITLSFETNGGSAVEPLTQNAGTALTLPANPTKEGFVFSGWYLDADFTTPFTATTFPENDTTLYAKWVEEPVYIETAHNGKAAMLTAAAAKNGKQGIRLYNKIDKAYVRENAQEFGAIAIRKDFLKSVYQYVNGAALTLDTAAEIENAFTLELRTAYAEKDSKYSAAPGFGLGVSYEKEKPNEAKLWAEDETSYEFTAYLTGIAPRYHADLYYIRAYAVQNDGAVLYGKVQELCVYDLVEAILNPENQAGQTDIEAANAVIKQAEAAAETDARVVTYAAWLQAKSAP